MMRTIWLFVLLTASLGGDVGREMRATRMSVVDFWKNETLGDGLNIRVAHGVNSWPDLVEQLHEPFLNKSMLIEGDVFLQTHRRPRQRAIPVMRADTRVADRITFKEWLREVSGLRKAIKINFRSTEVVRPVMQYLYASQADPSSPVLEYPVILHANVFRASRSIEAAVDAETFVDKAKKLFPDATLSLGWTKQSNFSHLNPKYKRLSWRGLFHILEYITRLDQPVMLSVRLSVAAHSKDKLLWLLGMHQSLSLLIWSDHEDKIDDWDGIAELRQRATKNRVLYDLDTEHRQILQNMSSEPIVVPASFPLSQWRTVEFGSSGDLTSTVVGSDRGVAFIGGPSAVLLSQINPPAFPSKQVVEGKVHFLPKHSNEDTHREDENGLLIYLLDKVRDIDPSAMKEALHIYIGHDGRISIENNHRKNYYESKSSAQLPKSSCYAFRVIDKGWRVIADVWTTGCEGSRHKRHAKKEVISRVQLDTPFNRRNRNLRSVVVSKSGDGSVDFLLEELHHNASLVTKIFVTFILVLLYFW